MNEATVETVEINGSAHSRQEAGILTPDAQMVVLTWVTFFLLLIILYKFAWKPILAALDAREENIRKSLDDAKKAREELARVEETSRKIVAAADDQAKSIVERSKKAAQEAANVIEHKAKEEVSILLNNATSEIDAMQKKVEMNLRQESANLAVQLAGKIIDEQLTKDKHEKLIDKFIKEFNP